MSKFSIGDRVVCLHKDLNTNKTATVVDIKPHNDYGVELVLKFDHGECPYYFIEKYYRLLTKLDKALE